MRTEGIKSASEGRKISRQIIETRKMRDMAASSEEAARDLGHGNTRSAGLLYKAAQQLNGAADRIEELATVLNAAHTDIAAILPDGV